MTGGGCGIGRALADEIVESHGGVQIPVNNAGLTAWGSFEEMSFEDLDRVLDVNLKEVINGCKFFPPYLRKEAEGHIGIVSRPLVPGSQIYSEYLEQARRFTDSSWDHHGGTSIVLQHPTMSPDEMFEPAGWAI